MFCLALDACYAYGLMTGPAVDVGRCEAILAQARTDGRRIPALDEVLTKGGR